MKGNWGTVIIGLMITLLVIAAAMLALYYWPDNSAQTINPTAVVTIIDAPTMTPLPTQTSFPTVTPMPTEVIEAPSGFVIGSFAQIYGTDGDGLRIRSGPGQSYAVNFVGLDAEVFQIIGGPEESDGYIWWQLEAPYDIGRNGWAVEVYLQIVDSE